MLIKAQTTESSNISTVDFQGKKKVKSIPKNNVYCFVIVAPTMMPMTMPSRHDVRTKSSAS